MPNQALLAELIELLRIPTISSGGGTPTALRRGAEWLVAKIESAGGSAKVEDGYGNPLVVGRLSANRPEAPTIMIYGHYDVQSADPIEAWESPPFEPTIRGDRLYARGASDDKGNFYPLLFVACGLAERGELPVDVRVVVEGEEEVGSENIQRWLAEDPEGADCCIVFDSLMVDTDTPALTIAGRGMVGVEIDVRTAPRDLHSGLYGGAALNAVHVLHAMLGEVLPGPDGRVRVELRAGIEPPAPEEVESWAALPRGDEVLAGVEARPIAETSGPEYYLRTGADASVDVNGFAGGDAHQRRTIIPGEARAKVSLRLAPGQDATEMGAVLVDLLRRTAPPNAEADVRIYSAADAARFDPKHPAIRLGAEAIGRAFGRAPALIRLGGTLPILAALSKRGIPTILSGFALADDAIHAANESFRLESLDLGERAARELYGALAQLNS